MPRLAASLQVSNGRGSGTLTRPDCSPSQFSVTVSATGNVSGEGYLNCAIGAAGAGTYSAGSLKIYGSVKDRSLYLEFRTDQREFAVVLHFRAGADAESTAFSGRIVAEALIAL